MERVRIGCPELPPVIAASALSRSEAGCVIHDQSPASAALLRQLALSDALPQDVGAGVLARLRLEAA